MNDVVDISYVSGYFYHVIFDDGLHGEVNFSEYPQKGPVFAPLKELGFFRKAFIEGGTIAWPNGADVAPESLYEKLPGNAKPLLRLSTRKINTRICGK